MRVGVYVDAFNLYYGARDQCGRGSKGWRWLDISSLVESQITTRRSWGGSVVTRLVYCTALRSKDGDPSSVEDQKAYIAALKEDKRLSVELGQYRQKHGRGVLARPAAKSRRRRYERVVWPKGIALPAGFSFGEVRGAGGETNISIHYATYEEKGSDVNLASHLLMDILQKRVDAAIVVSNDGDLRLPLSFARTRVPLGLINPGLRATSEMLKGTSEEGVGNHWWHRLRSEDFFKHQLPNPVGGYALPNGW